MSRHLDQGRCSSADLGLALREEEIEHFPTWDAVINRPGYVAKTISSTDHLVKVIGRYDFTERHPCGLSDCCQPHLHGWVVIDTKGRSTNLGSYCGPKHFPNLSDLRHEFTRVSKAKRARERLNEWKSKVSDVNKRLEELKSQRFGAHWLLDLMRAFQEGLPPSVVSELKQRARKNDPEIVQVRQRSSQEVAELVQRGERADQVRYEQRLIGVLTGLEIFRADNNLSNVVGQKIFRPLKAISELSIAAPVAEIEQATRSADEAERHLDALPSLFSAGLAFVSEANLKLLRHLTKDPTESTKLSTLILELDPPRLTFSNYSRPHSRQKR